MLFCAFILMTIVSSPAITSLSWKTIKPCRSSYGDSSFQEFRCPNGTACISIERICDGVPDCADGSDELFCLPPKQRLKRLSACVVPARPPNGLYEVNDSPAAEPGKSYESIVLSVRCRLGFGVADTSNDQVFCVNGRWFQKLPRCVRYCKLEPHESVRYSCRGNAGVISCDQYMAPGTMVKATCNSPIYYTTETLPVMKCVAGSWDNVARCKAECGRITPKSWALLIDGRPAKRGELPWHVGIYRKTTDPYMQICGGSLISNNVVISAAHCFWNDVEKKLPASGFAVAIGKLYRPWDHERDFDAQKSDVQEIRIPRLFQGELANYQQDIAVLILTTSFIYKPHIRPVCVVFDKDFNRFQLQHGKLGKVAGWGISTAQGNPSKILQVAEMPYISEDVCINTLPQSFREYITGDKFCAGYTNGTAVCRGDSGGGLTFPDRELGINRYYLRGIVSTAPKLDDSSKCNVDTYTAFTKIIDHEDFIKEAMQASREQVCPMYLFQCADGTCVDQGADCNGILECPDSSDESEELCKIAPIKPPGNCKLPPYPEHGTYTVLNSLDARPGLTGDVWSLTVECKQGYGVANGVNITEDKVHVFCIYGSWSQEMPKCERYCTLNPNPSVNYFCPLNEESAKQQAACGKKVVSGTVVIPRCNEPNYYSTSLLTTMHCVDGFWDYLATCSPECGRVTPMSTPLIIGGQIAERGELPWHVGVYTKTTQPYTQICGGSIITNNVVLSGAHCFWADIRGVESASNYAVAGGKLYRPWDNVKDVDPQKSDIKEIKVPRRFQGSRANFQDDIAALVLVTPFVYKTFLRPICIDFDHNFEKVHLTQGVLGKTAGWGLTEPEGKPSLVLKSVELPYVNIEQCMSSVPDSFAPYITSDKFCAGYNNGTTLCKFDSGGGLAFPSNERGVYRYYLRGITSTAPSSEQLCNPLTIVTFTSISSHEVFIKPFLR